MIPQIENFAGGRYRHLNPEARDELIQNSVALAWVRYLALAAQGKHQDPAVVDGMIYWSISHSGQGRLAHGKGQAKGKCVLDYARRGIKGVRLAPESQLQHHVSLESPVPTQAAFRVDTSTWLGTLTDRDRQIAIDLAEGFTTSEVAKRNDVSPARISQLRRAFEASYWKFHGEAA
jgi:hypothetical protein